MNVDWDRIRIGSDAGATASTLCSRADEDPTEGPVGRALWAVMSRGSTGAVTTFSRLDPSHTGTQGGGIRVHRHHHSSSRAPHALTDCHRLRGRGEEWEGRKARSRCRLPWSRVPIASAAAAEPGMGESGTSRAQPHTRPPLQGQKGGGGHNGVAEATSPQWPHRTQAGQLLPQPRPSPLSQQLQHPPSFHSQPPPSSTRHSHTSTHHPLSPSPNPRTPPFTASISLTSPLLLLSLPSPSLPLPFPSPPLLPSFHPSHGQLAVSGVVPCGVGVRAGVGWMSDSVGQSLPLQRVGVERRRHAQCQLHPHRRVSHFPATPTATASLHIHLSTPPLTISDIRSLPASLSPVYSLSFRTSYFYSSPPALGTLLSVGHAFSHPRHSALPCPRPLPSLPALPRLRTLHHSTDRVPSLSWSSSSASLCHWLRWRVCVWLCQIGDTIDYGDGSGLSVDVFVTYVSVAADWFMGTSSFRSSAAITVPFSATASDSSLTPALLTVHSASVCLSFLCLASLQPHLRRRRALHRGVDRLLPLVVHRQCRQRRVDRGDLRHPWHRLLPDPHLRTARHHPYHPGSEQRRYPHR